MIQDDFEWKLQWHPHADNANTYAQEQILQQFVLSYLPIMFRRAISLTSNCQNVVSLLVLAFRGSICDQTRDARCGCLLTSGSIASDQNVKVPRQRAEFTVKQQQTC